MSELDLAFLIRRKSSTHGCSLLNSHEAKEGRDCCEAHDDDIICSIKYKVRRCIRRWNRQRVKAETAVEEANDPTIDSRAKQRQTGLEKRKMGREERLLGGGRQVDITATPRTRGGSGPIHGSQLARSISVW